MSQDEFTDTRPIYLVEQQDGTHAFWPAMFDDQCGHCLGDRCAPAHLRFEKQEFDADMAALEAASELIFTALASTAVPRILAPPCVETEMDFWVAVLGSAA